MQDEEAEKGENGAQTRLKNFLANDGPDESESESRPIADLFPETSVLYADIAGFTSWSSAREPNQVFTLLETIYRAFDEIAKVRVNFLFLLFLARRRGTGTHFLDIFFRPYSFDVYTR